MRPHLRGIERDGEVDEAGIQWCRDAWEGSTTITTLSELERYDSARRPRPQRGCFFHYNALRRIMEGLPTDLQ